jgi:hypothetical protein
MKSWFTLYPHIYFFPHLWQQRSRSHVPKFQEAHYKQETDIQRRQLLYGPIHSLRYGLKQFSFILKLLKSYFETGTRGFWLEIPVYLDGKQCDALDVFEGFGGTCCFYLGYMNLKMNDIHIKFNKNLPSNSRSESCRRTDWHCLPVYISVTHIGQRTHNDK